MADFSSVQAILFDLDGVLVDSRKLHYDALNRALADEGPEYVIGLEEHLAKYDGCTTKTKLARLTNEKGLPVERHADVWASKQRYTETLITEIIPPNPRLRDILETLAGEYKLFCASNSIRRTIESMLSSLGVRDVFTNVYSNDDVIHFKPHPNIYLRCFVDNGLVPQQCVIVEDSPIGRMAATLSGGHVCPVASPNQVTLDRITKVIQESEKKNASRTIDTRWLSDVQVVIPMAGRGSRFSIAGYDVPKPLIEVIDRPMIQWVVENLNLADAHFLFIVQEAHLNEKTKSLLETCAPGCTIVPTREVTEGPACSVLLAREHLDMEKPLLIANSDQFLEWDANAFMYQSQEVDGSISVFQQSDPTDTKWSYASLDENGYVKETREKQVISTLASTGVYYWKRAGDFCKYADQMIMENTRVNNEFYVCPMYNYAVKDGMKIRAIECQRMWGLGVPDDLKTFLKSRVV